MRDVVRTQAMLADHIGVEQWHSVIGSSMGGMQALEWAVMFPQRVNSLACIASTCAASALQIGWSETGRLAIVNDAKWNGGDYYDAPDGEGPTEGLMLGRRIAQIHYRSDISLEDRFGRSSIDRLDSFDHWDRFQVESYLDYHGQKLARRFDANSYLVLNKAMDLHDIGRGRGGIEAAAARVTAPSLVVSIDSDMLYTPRQQERMRDALVAGGVDVTFEVLHSVHGHDGFLIDYPDLGAMLASFLDEQSKVN
jgi:homoserine O-acetyltransferase